MARKPRKGFPFLKSSGMICLPFRLVLVGKLDEYIFEIGHERANLFRVYANSFQFAFQLGLGDLVVHQCMDGATEDSGRAYEWQLAGTPQRCGYVLYGDFEPLRSGRLHVGDFAQRVRSAVGDQLAVIDVGEVRAALGFVHVVRGHKKRDAATAQIEEQVPQLAPSYGIDAGRRLVQVNDLGIVEHGAAQREPLFPAAGELAGKTLFVRFDGITMHGLFNLAFGFSTAQAVDLRVEAQVFQHRKVVIQRELLAHVPEAQLDLVGILGDGYAMDHAAAGGERKNPAEHLDDRGLARAIGPEKSEYFPGLDFKAHAVDGDYVAELAHEIFRENGCHHFTSRNFTSALMPARSLPSGFCTRNLTPTT